MFDNNDLPNKINISHKLFNITDKVGEKLLAKTVKSLNINTFNEFTSYVNNVSKPSLKLREEFQVKSNLDLNTVDIEKNNMKEIGKINEDIKIIEKLQEINEQNLLNIQVNHTRKTFKPNEIQLIQRNKVKQFTMIDSQKNINFK